MSGCGGGCLDRAAAIMRMWGQRADQALPGDFCMRKNRTVPLTQDEIEQGLRRLGLSAGRCVEVHSSLSRFGLVQGGAETVIAALMQVIGPEGTIVMSAYTVSKVLPLTDEDLDNGLTCKVKVYPEGSDLPSGMGVIADTFRRRPDVVTGSGTLRVAAWGRDAARYAASGYSLVYETNGIALLLGVDINRMSSMHLAETDMPAWLWAQFNPPPSVGLLYPDDQWYVETGVTREGGWNKIQARAIGMGLVREQSIGRARCMAVPVREVVELYRDALRQNPRQLFGLDV